MRLSTIYEVTPAIYGDNYRYIKCFDNLWDAIEVLDLLKKKTAHDFDLYRLIEEENGKILYDSWKEGKNV